jgi:hypothetical protein
MGPLVAALALVIVIGAVAFAISRARGGDDQRDNTAASVPTPTAVAAAATTDEPTESGEEPTARPTRTAAAEGEAEPTATRRASGSSDSSDAASARSLLPGLSDLPEAFERTEDDRRTLEQVVAGFGDPDEASQLLQEWGWEENAYRTFQIPAGADLDPNATSFINVSVHRFGDEEGAASAMAYFVDAVVAAQGLEEFAVDPIGDDTVALQGSPDGANLTVIYVLWGNFLIRIGGSSVQGDPSQAVLDLATSILSSTAAG